MQGIIDLYLRNKNLIEMLKDVGVIVGAWRFIKYVAHKRMSDKWREMQNDLAVYKGMGDKLKEYVDGLGATTSPRLHDIYVCLMYIGNYPYDINDDGYRLSLFYRLSRSPASNGKHIPLGYISGKGLYVYSLSNIYYNQKNGRWFCSSHSDRMRKGYEKLDDYLLVMRIPFANILGYDFDSDISVNGEPVVYTRYRSSYLRLYADDVRFVKLDDNGRRVDSIESKKSKRAGKIRGRIKEIEILLKSKLKRLVRALGLQFNC